MISFPKVSPSSESKPTMEEKPSEPQTIGLAFSGGGIRSAAFSSGVLRRLLQKNIQIDSIGCVSGGNYTAASYLDWKYRHGKTDSHQWHYEFFEHMRQRAGYLCDWSKCYKGFFDTLFIVSTVIMANLMIPVIVWGGLSLPIAYCVDFIFGDIMRAGFNCTILIPESDPLSLVTRCLPRLDHHHPGVQGQILLFVSLLVSFLFFFVLNTIFSKSRILRFFQLSTGILFGTVFPPWVLQQFFDIIPTWITILVFVLSLFFWCGFPPLRRIASLAVIFYVFAFIIKWRVYRSRCIFLDYREDYFYSALLIGGLALWASPYLGTLTSAIIYFVMRWRLQYAFFTKESGGLFGCNGITCSGFFPICSPLCDFCCNKNKALSMADVSGMKPEYISNVEASNWLITPEKKEPSVLVGLGTEKIEVIASQPGYDRLECPLTTKDFKIADAMATGASIGKPRPAQEDLFQPYREILLILGLQAKLPTITNPGDGKKCSNKLAPILLQSIAGAPIIVLAVLWLGNFNSNPTLIEGIIVSVFLGYVVIFSIIAMMPTGDSKPWFGESFVRWCHVYLFHVRFLRSLFKINNIGPRPPAVMSLSDLGRLEKYGLLPLLKRRLKKIVVADGSLIRNDEDYANRLFETLEMARDHYNCEFNGYDGRDIIGEINKIYLKHPSGRLPRTYRFIVNYFDATATGFQKAGEGEILILAPRHPKEGFDFPTGNKYTWQEHRDDTGISLDPKRWGTGPVLRSDEVERLTFCCCECCHCKVGCCQAISKSILMGFPRHSTVNQFFTPQMFSAYHREGYRACIEGDIEGFLTNNIV